MGDDAHAAQQRASSLRSAPTQPLNSPSFGATQHDIFPPAVDQTRAAALAHKLQASVLGEVHLRDKEVQPDYDAKTGDASNGAPTSAFLESTTLFNSAVPLAAWLVVRPLSTKDVSNTIKFCNEHNLSPSIRSGGYSTAGWSIQGDVVLDMRNMNDLAMLPPAARYAPQYNAPLPAKSGSNQREGNIECRTNGHIDTKRRRAASDDESDSRCNTSKGQDLLPRVKSGDSGVDADDDSNSGSNGDRASDDAARDSPVAPTAWTASRPLVASPRIANDAPVSVSGSGSGSGSSADAGRTTAATTTTTTTSATEASSLDVEMSDGLDKSDAALSPEDASLSRPRSSASPQDGPNDATFEHQRWRKYHRPASNSRLPSFVATTSEGTPPSPSTSNGAPQQSARLQLPTTGGFIWTANNDDPGSMGTTRALNSADSDYLSGSRMSDMHYAQSQEQLERTATYVNGTSPGLQAGRGDRGESGSNGVHYASSGSQSDAHAKAGIHLQGYRLVEFGPGVGVRDLDLFTDRMGRDNFATPTPSQTRANGKMPVAPEHAQIDKVCADPGSSGTGNGVPYHVPLSAYPVGSTATTIGGFGYLSRAYGLSLDNIVELDLVLADGRVKTLNCLSVGSADAEERDLWWAVRGAAPCFGVVTRIVAKAYPVPRVYAGNMIYPFNPATAPSLVRHWRDCLKGTGGSVPRELYSNLILTAGPSTVSTQSEGVVVIQICYLGSSSSEEIGHNFVQAINSWTGERVLLKDVTEKSMLSQQDGVAQVLKSGQGKRWMARGDLLTTLTDDVIARTIKQFAAMEQGGVWLFELVAGAIEDGAKDNATCVGKEQREAKFTAAALQQWTDREEDASCVRGVEQWVNETLATVSVGGPFASFLERDESRSRCEGAFGKDNFARLLRVKRSVDPNGLFCHTFAQGLVNYALSDEHE